MFSRRMQHPLLKFALGICGAHRDIQGYLFGSKSVYSFRNGRFIEQKNIAPARAIIAAVSVRG